MPTITGNGGNNLLTGTNASDTIIGKGGNDTLRAGGGTASDSLFGDDGNDLLDSGTASGVLLLDGGNGNDTLIVRGPLNASDSLFGGAGTDLLDLSNISTDIQVNLGSPYLTAGGVTVIFLSDIENIRSGAGKDQLWGTSGNNRLSGGAGQDTINGALGTDVLYGEAGNDRLIQYNGFTRMYGGDGNDSFLIDFSTDAGSELLGGTGARDLLNLDSGFSWNVDLAANRARVTDGITQKQYGLQQIEDVSGGSAADVIRGDGQANRLRGYGGTDTLDGRGGNDTIIADGGAVIDRYVGGAGIDTLDLRAINIDGLALFTSGSCAYSGGSFASEGFEKVLGGNANEGLSDSKSLTHIYGGGGDDFITADSLAGGNEVFDGGAGRDGFYLGSNFTRDMVFNMATGALTGHKSAKGFEDALAGLGDDRVTGNDVNNRIDGYDGHDSLYGAGGTDHLIGRAGRDWLYGGAQNDRLVGDHGADHLFGGTGADVFAFVSGLDAGTGAARDVIHDYQAGQDTIIIDMFSGAMVLIGNAAFSGAAYEVRYFRAGQDMKVQIDTDGDATADFEVLVLDTNTINISLNT
jgi:Ca2+-binding RTX toxin-like protein